MGPAARWRRGFFSPASFLWHFYSRCGVLFDDCHAGTERRLRTYWSSWSGPMVLAFRAVMRFPSLFRGVVVLFHRASRTLFGVSVATIVHDFHVLSMPTWLLILSRMARAPVMLIDPESWRAHSLRRLLAKKRRPLQRRQLGGAGSSGEAVCAAGR